MKTFNDHHLNEAAPKRHAFRAMMSFCCFKKKRYYYFQELLQLSILSSAIIFLAITLTYQHPTYALPPQAGPSADLHTPYNQLLERYVLGTRFNYDRIFKNKQDLRRLYDYVNTLELQNPSTWPSQTALAFWINLYNAATLELVLKHYPVKSIKDIGGFLSSPWKQKVVKVAGKELTLNDIENSIIRPQFKDARIHFALNCASIGCPPLSNKAYQGQYLDKQLDNITRSAINNHTWVKISNQELWLTRIFKWYQDDFKEYSGSVRKFIAKYHTNSDKILQENHSIKYFQYNWNLNKTEQ